MHEEIRIILPVIPKVLQPNCAAGTIGMRFKKASAIKKQRRVTAEAVEQEECETLPWEKCHVHAIFYHKTKRGRDVDNAMGSLKSTYDGIVDAGVVSDDTPDKMVRDIPDLLIDKQHPRVELIITRLA